MKALAIVLLYLILTPSSLVSQEILTNDIIFLTYFKTKTESIPKKDLTLYLERYYKEEYNQKAVDKSTLSQYIDEKLEYYNNRLKTIKYKTEYITTTNITIKDYDKMKQAFNLDLDFFFKQGTINPAGKLSGKIDYVGKVSNIEYFKDLKMGCDDLIDNFVNANPAINKENIPVTINLSFYKRENDEINEFGSSVRFIGYVLCEINNITFHFSDTQEFVYTK